MIEAPRLFAVVPDAPIVEAVGPRLVQDVDPADHNIATALLLSRVLESLCVDVTLKI